MLIFLAANQAIISHQASKDIATLPNAKTYMSPAIEPVSIDNDQRGAHSYFLPARIFSARYSTNGGALAVSQSKENPENCVNPSNAVQGTPMRANAQDLLRSGYLRDNTAVYKPDFGASGKN